MSGDSVDPWATLDELLGTEVLSHHPTESGIGRLAFYGRCSTEDNQDPKTSKAWQLGEAARFVEPLGGVVVESSSTSVSRVRCHGNDETRPVVRCRL